MHGQKRRGRELLLSGAFEVTAPCAIHRRQWVVHARSANAKQTAFPIAPGGAMPPVEGCAKQDYAVLIVIGMGVED
jgi:hypothetical protein